MDADDNNLNRTANEVSRELSSLLIRRGLASYDIGRVIEQVYSKRLWKYWPESTFASVGEWCWSVLHFKERKAQYLRKNFLKLSSLCLGDELAFENTKIRAIRLGWTKLGHILDMSTSETELVAWIDRVEEEQLREIDLQNLKALYQAGVIKNASDVIPNRTAEKDDGGKDDKSKDDKPKKIHWKMVFADPDDLKVFTDVLEIVRNRIHPGMGLGKAAALMATSYLAHVPRSDEGGVVVEVEYILRAIERNWGVKLAPVEVEREELAQVQTYGSDEEATNAIFGF